MRSIITILFCCACAAAAEHKTQNIIFVMTDGLRWQEVFGGADTSLVVKKDVKASQDYTKGADSALRREALMPFLWSTIAHQGQIFGNQNLGSEAYVTNGLNFSYPGYNETLCGFPDPRIHSNDKVLNPNRTVFEWFNGKPAYKGSMAAFGAWDVFPFIFNEPRAGFPVNAGYTPFLAMPMTPRLELLNQMKAESPKVWDDEAFDAIPFYTALEYLKAKKPKLLYISLGETDDWAHAGNYAEYLNSAHRVDEFLAELWGAVKGFGDFRNDPSLTALELEMIVQWVEGGAPEGDPAFLAKPVAQPVTVNPKLRWIAAPRSVVKPMTLTAIRASGPTEVSAYLPNGEVQHLLWICDKQSNWKQAYIFREPVTLPLGTKIQVTGATVEISEGERR